MRRGAYTVRRPNWRRVLGSLATLAFMVAFVVVGGFISHFGTFAVVFLAFAAYATLGEAWRSSLRLRIDGDGVLVREPAPGTTGRAVSVPWSSIRELVLSTEYVPGSVEPVPTRLGVRLHPGAPLPAGAHAVIHDPNAPDDPRQRCRSR
jgi:hypothetical protein